MAVDEGQGQLRDLLESSLVPLVFVDPRADLLQQILGDIDGACLALLLEGELMADVEWAVLGTVAGGIATAAADGAQAGGQQRAGWVALFEAAVQLSADQGGMLGQTHGSLRKKGESLHSKSMRKEGAKKERCEKNGGTGGQTVLTPKRAKTGFSSVQQVRRNYRSSVLATT